MHVNLTCFSGVYEYGFLRSPSPLGSMQDSALWVRVFRGSHRRALDHGSMSIRRSFRKVRDRFNTSSHDEGSDISY